MNDSINIHISFIFSPYLSLEVTLFRHVLSARGYIVKVVLCVWCFRQL